MPGSAFCSVKHHLLSLGWQQTSLSELTVFSLIIDMCPHTIPPQLNSCPSSSALSTACSPSFLFIYFLVYSLIIPPTPCSFACFFTFNALLCWCSGWKNVGMDWHLPNRWKEWKQKNHWWFIYSFTNLVVGRLTVLFRAFITAYDPPLPPFFSVLSPFYCYIVTPPNGITITVWKGRLSVTVI